MIRGAGPALDGLQLGCKLMEHGADHPNGQDQQPSRSSAAKIALFGFLAVAAFYLITEHRAHLLGWLPWLVILACPLLHVFMHGGHGGHGGQSNDSSLRGRQPPHQH